MTLPFHLPQCLLLFLLILSTQHSSYHPHASFFASDGTSPDNDASSTSSSSSSHFNAHAYHDALQISIENSRHDFHESALQSYFPVILSKQNIIYCQNLAESDEEFARKQNAHILDPNIVQKKVVNGLRQIFPKADSKCTYLMSGWWVYEFCFQKYVRQFHQEQDQTVTMEFFLGYGNLNGEVHHFVLDKDDGENSFVAFLFENGTKCDLTGKPRSTEVRFYCNTEQPSVENYFGQVEEPESCTYLVKYYMKKLCEFDGFGKKEEKIQRMQCLEKSEFEKFIAEKKSRKTGDLDPPLDESLVEDPEVKTSGSDLTQSTGNAPNEQKEIQEHINTDGDPLIFLDEEDHAAAQRDLDEQNQIYTPKDYGSGSTPAVSHNDGETEFERRLHKELSLDEDDYEQWVVTEDGTTTPDERTTTPTEKSNQKDEL